VTTIAITNQKGGVGKTTTTVNLAASLAANGQRVLLIDLDPQGNATMGCGVDKHALEFSVYDVLMHGAHVEAVRQRAQDAGFDVIPANADLTAAEVELVTSSVREHRLRDALARVKHDYDYVLIDCPPSLNMLTVNALVAADSVLIPVQCEYYALEGLSSLAQHGHAGAEDIEPATQDRRPVAHDARRAQLPDQRSVDAAHPALRLARVRHADPAQRASGRGAEPRHAGAGL
jgi:chromosome partitioning protein